MPAKFFTRPKNEAAAVDLPHTPYPAAKLMETTDPAQRGCQEGS